MLVILNNYVRTNVSQFCSNKIDKSFVLVIKLNGQFYSHLISFPKSKNRHLIIYLRRAPSGGWRMHSIQYYGLR